MQDIAEVLNCVNVQDEKMRKALNVLQEHPELSELIVRLASG